MRAVVCQNAELSLAEIAEPAPRESQVLVKVLRCGICGSDLHARHHYDHMRALMDRVNYGEVFGSSRDRIVFGHEFCCEVLDHGPDCRRTLKAGTRVVAQPLVVAAGTVHMAGFSPHFNGAYAERMLLDEQSLVPVPNGLSAELAALTEPMAVAHHAVRRSEATRRDVAIVVGCGPVGLAVICLLKARGVRTIVASDFSAGRRALAKSCGADVVVNPADTSPYANWQEFGFLGDLPAALDLVRETRAKLGRLPLPWYTTWRIAEALGAAPPRPIVFECVGVPGVLQQIVEGAPLLTRIVVVGVCMQVDRLEPALAVQKEVEMRFVFGHSPLEYRDTVHLIADGKIDCAPLITGTVGLPGVAPAFEALRDPERHAKILVDPASSAAAA